MNNLPDRISRYRVLVVLGVGGFGTVVSALDEALDAQVAVKILGPEHARDAAVRDRFVREAQLLRRVHSPHVIGVHDIGSLDDGRPYLVMELATGGVLRDRIGRGQAADAAGVRATIGALAKGLGALHAAGIVHRDITPANLLIVDDSLSSGAGAVTVQRAGLLAEAERVVIGDLGLAKDQERTSAGPTIVGGTPFFRSPEQSRHGEEVGPPADVYGATGVLWNLLTGEPPGGEAALEAQLATVPPIWRPVLEQGLAFEPADRFPTMVEWEAAALDAMDRDSGSRRVGFNAAVAGATCPYKGLASYQPEDASFFFGRESLVDDLVARLQASSTLVIGGPSGSGKSSLMRAGLVPAIAKGALPGSQHWPVALFCPGGSPLEELALQFDRLWPDSDAPAAGELRDDPESMKRWLPKGASGLVAIDQFEEVFTQRTDPSDLRAFFAVLAALTTQVSQVRVVMALRSDFYSACAAYPWPADCISHNQVLVGPMRRQELRRAIEGPSRRAGLRLEAGLIDAFLDEAGDEPGGLPLIAHSLMETWMRRRGTVLTVEGFHAAGGVIGAIAQTAEQSHERLDPAGRIASRRLFLRLVTPGTDSPDTRRRLAWDEMSEDSATSEVIEQLARDRLLTVDEQGVSLVHETLIGSWPRLRDWIGEAREDLGLQQRIGRAADEWEAEDRDPDLLYRGARLASVLEWNQQSDLDLAGTARSFLEAGRKARDDDERAGRAEESRRRGRRRSAIGALSFLAVAALVASVVAFGALQRSRANEATAENRFARGLATQAESLASTRPKLALALAAESMARVDPTPVEAQQATVMARLALANSDIVPRSEPIPVGDTLTVVVSPDGKTMVTGARDGTVRLWDTKTGERTATLTGPTKGIEEAVVDPQGRWLVAVGDDGLWRWTLGGGSTQGRLIDRSPAPLWSASFSADGSRLATAAENGILQVYSTSTWKPAGQPFRADIDFLSVAFTLDGKLLLAGTGDGRVFIWDIAGHKQVGTPIHAHGTNDVWELIMNPNGKTVATGSSDGTARIWSLDTGELVASPFAKSAKDGGVEVAGLSWSADGKSLFAGGAGGAVHEWNVDDGAEADASATGHDDIVIDASVSSGATLLATLGRDQDVRLWDIEPRQPTITSIETSGRAFYGLAMSADGAEVAAGDDRGVIHLLSSSGDAHVLTGHTRRVFGLAFLPSGRLVSGDDAGNLRVWDPASGRALAIGTGANQSPITSIAADPDGDRFATSGGDGAIRVWSATQLDGPIAETRAVGVSATKVVFTAAGTLAASYADGYVRFWRGNGSQLRAPLRVDTGSDMVFSLDVSRDGKLLAAATATGGVSLWDLRTGRSRGEINRQPVAPVDVVFTSDGSALASATRQGTIVLWSTSTGQSIGPRFDFHSKAVWRLAVSPSAVVVAASEDGRISRLDALDLDRSCHLAADALDRRAREHYLGGRDPIGCDR